MTKKEKPDEYENQILALDEIYDSSLSLTQECDRVRDLWRDAMKRAGLHIGVGGKRQIVGQQGRIVLAWFKGRTERFYYAVYDPANRQVTNERNPRKEK